MQANWKLLVENSIDGYHASSTHDTCFKYLVWLGADLRRPGRRRHQGSERWPRGAGIPAAPGPRGRQAGTAVRAPKQVIEALRTRLAAEHGPNGPGGYAISIATCSSVPGGFATPDNIEAPDTFGPSKARQVLGPRRPCAAPWRSPPAGSRSRPGTTAPA